MTNSLLIVLTVLCLHAQAPAQPIHFDRIDQNHSTIAFLVPIMGGMSQVTGKFMDFEARITYDEDNVENSAIEMQVTMESITTGIAARDKHLRSDDFFAVERHPEATFKSKRVERKEDELFVTGDFTLRGVTREITVPFNVTGFLKHESDNNDGAVFATAGFQARFTVNRFEYGLEWQHDSVANFVDETITIDINLLTRSKKIE